MTYRSVLTAYYWINIMPFWFADNTKKNAKYGLFFADRYFKKRCRSQGTTFCQGILNFFSSFSSFFTGVTVFTLFRSVSIGQVMWVSKESTTLQHWNVLFGLFRKHLSAIWNWIWMNYENLPMHINVILQLSMKSIFRSKFVTFSLFLIQT